MNGASNAMTCNESGVVGGVGCVLPAGHDGSHETREGATWPALIEMDCPRCGALMHTADPHTDLPCVACQDDDLRA